MRLFKFLSKPYEPTSVIITNKLSFSEQTDVFDDLPALATQTPLI